MTERRRDWAFSATRVLRVLHLDTEPSWRGGENQLRLLVEGMIRRGHEPHVAVRAGSELAERMQATAPCLLLRGTAAGYLADAIAIKRYCETHDIPLIDAHTSKSHALALAANRLAPRLKVVVHRRVDYPPGRGFFSQKKYESQRVARYVAISDAIREVLARWGVSADRISVAKSAVDPAPYQEKDKAREKTALAHHLGISADVPFLGNASALTEQKGYPTFLRALKDLKDHGRKFHAVIAGEGKLTAELEKLRAELGLEYDVTFMGFVADVPRFLSALDVLCVPSNDEGLGTILLEGAHAGCALVATRVGGIPEIVRDGETGLLVPPREPERLAEALDSILRDEEGRLAFAQSATAFVAREFSVDRMVESNLAVYDSLLPQENGREHP